MPARSVARLAAHSTHLDPQSKITFLAPHRNLEAKAYDSIDDFVVESSDEELDPAPTPTQNRFQTNGDAV